MDKFPISRLKADQIKQLDNQVVFLLGNLLGTVPTGFTAEQVEQLQSLDPVTINILVNLLIMLATSIINATSSTEEEAKAKMMSIMVLLEVLPKAPVR